jgi:hypothetical protein
MAPNPKDLLSGAIERGRQVASKGEELVRSVRGGGDGATGGDAEPESGGTVTPIRAEQGTRATSKGAATTPGTTATERAQRAGTKRKPSTRRPTTKAKPRAAGAPTKAPANPKAATPRGTRRSTATEAAASSGDEVADAAREA